MGGVPMSGFWVLFWVGGIGIPLVYRLASLTKSSGFQKSSSHIWVTPRSHRKVKDATVRDVWKKHNPGKSWSEYQDKKVRDLGIFFALLFTIGVIWLNAELQLVRLPIWKQALAFLAGGGFSAFALKFLDLIGNPPYSSRVKNILHYLFLGLAGLSLAGGLTLTILGNPLPISQHWVWAPLGAVFLLFALEMTLFQYLRAQKQKKAHEKGLELGKWVLRVMQEVNHLQKKDSIQLQGNTMMQKFLACLGKGYLDHLYRAGDFFQETEDIMLALVTGQQISLDEHLYKNREELIKAVQAAYFYGTQHFRHEIHPKIQAKLE
jgi:hypothetical protein